MVVSNRFCHFGGWSDRRAPRRWTARRAQAKDFDCWDELFAGYCDFYERPADPEHRRRVWSWIQAGTIHCLLALPAAAGEGARGSGRLPGPAVAGDPSEGRPIGLAHVRPMPSPLRGATTGFLDDLFIVPAARGSGAFECLVAAIGDLAATEGWPDVRWITAADNGRARRAYDRVATKTDWVTYQLEI